MKTLKKQEHQHRHFGHSDNLKELRVINIVALVIISAYNILFHVIHNSNITPMLLNVGVFLLSALFLYRFKNRIVLYSVYLIIGSLTIVFAERVIEYSGLVFIIFACGIMREYKYLLISFTLAFMSLSVRLTLLSNPIPITIQMLLLFCFISATAYLIFFKRHKRRVDLWAEISEKEKAILKLFMRGYDYAKISKVLKVKDKKESIRTSITRCRNLSGCENDIQFGIWLSEKG